MKTKATFIALMIFTCVSASAQDSTISEVTVADLRLDKCSFEPSANAMKLLDVQQVEFEPSPFGGKIITDKTVRIKLFNENGYPEATITIPYYMNKNNTRVDKLQGTVYTLSPNGTIQKQELVEADFYKEKAMDKVGLVKFTFPNLRPGCIIEYRYTIAEKNRLSIDNWVIQSSIPSKYSLLSILIPAYSEIRDITFGKDSVSRKKELLTKGFDKIKYTFYKQQVKSFTPEPFMSSLSDNLLRMGFILVEDNRRQFGSNSPLALWRMFANMLLKSQGYDDLQKKAIPGTEKIIDTALTYVNHEDRLKYLYRTVKNRFAEKSGNAIFADDISHAWKNRQASSAEINLILHNFLSRANVTNYPVFVSTRDHGKINKEFPSFAQFNHLDLLVDIRGTNFLVDASQKFQPYYAPPMNVLNREVFILNPDNISWASISDNRPLVKQSTDIFGSLTTKGIYEAGATINYYDYAKMMALDSTLIREENENQRFFSKNVLGLKILKDEVANTDNDEPLMRTLEFDYELPNQGDFYFLNPQLFASGKINPFVKETRESDIDFGSNQEMRLSLQLDLPENMVAEELPKNIVIKSPDESFVFTRIISVHKTKLSYSHILEIRKAVFDKGEYPALADFFKQVQKLVSEEIILKKKS